MVLEYYIVDANDGEFEVWSVVTKEDALLSILGAKEDTRNDFHNFVFKGSLAECNATIKILDEMELE